MRNYKFIIILILIIFILLSLKKESFSENLSTLNKFKKTDDKIIKKIAEGMMIIDHMFRKNKIDYLISYGTLLGAVRHKQIIPWDDDADLIIFRNDINKILKLKKDFEKLGWTIEKEWKLLKLYPLDNDGNKTDLTFIDLFITDYYGKKNKKVIRCLIKDYNKKCVQLSKNHNWYHKWYHFPKYYLDGRKEYIFKNKKLGYNFKMIGPKNPEKVLKFWYGDDCLTSCQTPIYDHNTGKYVKSYRMDCKLLNKKFFK